MALLADNRYGKHKVRVVKVTREDGVHTVREWSVNVLIQGDYDDAFRTGSNSDILPTDTMKNTVYSIARRSNATCIEDFAKDLISHFLTNYGHADAVSVDISEKPWTHLEVQRQASSHQLPAKQRRAANDFSRRLAKRRSASHFGTQRPDYPQDRRLGI